MDWRHQGGLPGGGEEEPKLAPEGQTGRKEQAGKKEQPACSLLLPDH